MHNAAALHAVRCVIGHVKGLVSVEQGAWLFSAVQLLPEDARIVEIGAYLGRSTVALALGCVGSKRHVFSIDTFRGIYCNEHVGESFEEDFFELWRGNIQEVGLLEYVSPLCNDSKEAVKTWEGPINLLFIDGSHWYEDVLADFEGFYPHVVGGGIIVLHDVTPAFRGPFRVWNEVVRDQLEDVGSCGALAYGRKSDGVGKG